MTQNFNIFMYGANEGLLKIDMYGNTPVSSRVGNIAQAVFRVIGLPGTGSTVMDLQWVQLNAGQMVLTPVPVPGEDGTDGRLAISAAVPRSERSSVPLPSRIVRPMHGADINQWRKVVTPSGGTANSTTSKLVQWNRPSTESTPVTSKVRKTSASNWMRSFATTLADEASNPNNHIQVTLPAMQRDAVVPLNKGVLLEEAIDSLSVV